MGAAISGVTAMIAVPALFVFGVFSAMAAQKLKGFVKDDDMKQNNSHYDSVKKARDYNIILASSGMILSLILLFMVFII